MVLWVFITNYTPVTSSNIIIAANLFVEKTESMKWMYWFLNIISRPIKDPEVKRRPLIFDTDLHIPEAS